MKPRFHLAQASAAAVIEQAGVRYAHVEIEEIVRSRGILLVNGRDLGEGVHGAAYTDGTRQIIYISPAVKGEERRRFTIAHELGHLQLHGDQGFLTDKGVAYFHRDSTSSLGRDWREIEANQFAAALLMPANLLKAAIDDLERDVSHEEIVSLADQFKVSASAMAIRLQTIGLLGSF